MQIPPRPALIFKQYFRKESYRKNKYGVFFGGSPGYHRQLQIFR